MRKYIKALVFVFLIAKANMAFAQDISKASLCSLVLQKLPMSDSLPVLRRFAQPYVGERHVDLVSQDLQSELRSALKVFGLSEDSLSSLFSVEEGSLSTRVLSDRLYKFFRHEENFIYSQKPNLLKEVKRSFDRIESSFGRTALWSRMIFFLREFSRAYGGEYNSDFYRSRTRAMDRVQSSLVGEEVVSGTNPIFRPMATDSSAQIPEIIQWLDSLRPKDTLDAAEGNFSRSRAFDPLHGLPNMKTFGTFGPASSVMQPPLDAAKEAPPGHNFPMWRPE